MNGRYGFFIQRSWSSHAFDFFLRRELDDNGQRKLAYPERLVMKLAEPEDEGRARPPLLQLTDDDCQQLMDELWRAGMRPTEGKGSAGALAAVEKHLGDMRAIVAEKLKVKL